MKDSPLTARDDPRHMRGLPGDALEKLRCEPRTFTLVFDGRREARSTRGPPPARSWPPP